MRAAAFPVSLAVAIASASFLSYYRQRRRIVASKKWKGRVCPRDGVLVPQAEGSTSRIRQEKRSQGLCMAQKFIDA
jgi:hypothetical protein